ncbi:MAG: PepSY domain-containing protein [Magnetococcales bacterium]|nr:PepSY domain-containing protein [Magnetococcales bacterium]
MMACWSFAPGPANSHETFPEPFHHTDHERARQLVRSGEILPLERILNGEPRVRGKQLIDVELETKKGILIYEVDMLDAHGALVEYQFDARTGAFLREKKED